MMALRKGGAVERLNTLEGVFHLFVSINGGLLELALVTFFRERLPTL